MRIITHNPAESPTSSQTIIRHSANNIKDAKFLYVVTLASLLITVGILWDISWHQSIGRDKFLTPPHILVYLGAIIGGLSSGIQVLLNTFSRIAEQRSSLVRVWGIFYSSFGALFCIWGAIAMLTSAPFDNWWHSAFGLDLQILSPPHFLLFAGIFSMQIGSCVCIAKHINITDPADKSLRSLQFLFIITTSTFICMIYTLASSYIRIGGMRRAGFYQVTSAIALLLLPAFRRELRMKWGMTAIAVSYFLISATINWVLQIFPAEPKLVPILTHTTHFQPANFPLLIMIPAVFMDLVMQKSTRNDWSKAAGMSLIFVLVFVLVQYPFSGFLRQSPAARNWFFGANSWYFENPPDAPFRYKFSPAEIQPLPFFTTGIAIAIVTGILITRISFTWGDWLLRIQR